MSRVKMTQSITDAVIAMAEGNPGAATVLMELAQKSPHIDPASDSSMIPLMHLDDMGIYGANIWILFSDICHKDIVFTLAVIRARQLGLISMPQVVSAIADARVNRTQNVFHVPTILARVKEFLPDFAKEVTVGEQESTS